MVVLAVCAVLAAPVWTQVERNPRIQLEKRDVRGSDYPELRLQAHSRASPEQLAAAIWLKHDGKYEKMKSLSRTLLETPTDRRRYERLATPVIADRDYIVHQRLLIDRATNVYQMIYAAETDAAHPPQPGFVRVEKMSGTWTFEPAEGGGTDVTYICHSDPAGNLPAFLARGAQIDAAKVVWAEVEADALAHPELRLSAR
jgi:hypothetical protein